MSSSGSVSIWIEELKNGDGLAAQRLWEGYTEIAEKLGCVPRTIERKVALIRSLWEEAAPPS